MNLGIPAIKRAALVVLLLSLPGAAQARKAQAGLDSEARKVVSAAMQTALETHVSGRSRQWSARSSGYTGRITPVATWRSRSGHFCRAFVEIVRLPSGIERTGIGRACRNDAGKWVRI